MARFIGKRHNGAGQATLGEHVVARCSLLCRTLQNNCKAQEATIESTGAILGLLGIWLLLCDRNNWAVPYFLAIGLTMLCAGAALTSLVVAR